MSSPPPDDDDDGAQEVGANAGGGDGRSLGYGEAEYWDARYVEEGGAPYDWYQRYDALRPFVRRFVPPASRILVVGCGSARTQSPQTCSLLLATLPIILSAPVITDERSCRCGVASLSSNSSMFPKVESSVMSEDMVNDGYVEIVNIDISSVVIEMMRKKYFNVPQLQYLRMDVRDMSMFPDESFDCAIDKGTLDSLMCGVDAPLSAAQMILEVDRLLKPGGVFILITYGDPSVRVPHLNQSACDWKIVLYILPRPGFTEKIRRRVLDPVPLTERGRLPDGFVPEDPDSHYVYVCEKMQGLTGTGSPTVNHIESQGEE